MKQVLLGVLVAAGLLLVAAPVVHAEDVFDAACQGGATSSQVCQNGQNAQENPFLGPNGLITRVTQLVVFVIGIAAVVVIIISGLRYITSAGDSAGVNNAKNGILYACVGLVVAVMGQVVVTFVLSKL